MRSDQPPKAAAWLLRHFGCSPNNDAVIGDLDERYRQGRSALWYWRQALLAIVMSFCKEIWSHKPLAIRALLVGWMVKLICLSVYYRYAVEYQRFHYDPIEAGIFVPFIGVIALMGTGWIIAHTHRYHARSMVLLYITVELLVAAMTVHSMVNSGAVVSYPWGLSFSFTWISALTQIIGGIFFYFGIFNTLADLWISTGIMVVTILIGAGCFRATDDANSHALKSASV